MNDLISRSALLKEFDSVTAQHIEDPLWHITGIKAIIENEPTAYDLDKVVEELDEYLFEKYCVEGDIKIDEIVKQGLGK